MVKLMCNSFSPSNSRSPSIIYQINVRVTVRGRIVVAPVDMSLTTEAASRTPLDDTAQYDPENIIEGGPEGSEGLSEWFDKSGMPQAIARCLMW